MFTFAKEERLRSRKEIDRLFSEGRKFHVAGFLVLHLQGAYASGPPARLLISVPRRKIRKAVHRNLLKRRIREAYRHHKQGFYRVLEANAVQCSFALVYTLTDVTAYREIEEKIISVLQRLEKEYEKAAR